MGGTASNNNNNNNNNNASSSFTQSKLDEHNNRNSSSFGSSSSSRGRKGRGGGGGGGGGGGESNQGHGYGQGQGQGQGRGFGGSDNNGWGYLPSFQSNASSEDDDVCECRFLGFCVGGGGARKGGGGRNSFGSRGGHYRKNRSRGGGGGRSSSNDNDPIGTPMPDTPPHIRRRRMEKLGLMSSKYDGLEKETSISLLRGIGGGGGGGSGGSDSNSGHHHHHHHRDGSGVGGADDAGNRGGVLSSIGGVRGKIFGGAGGGGQVGQVRHGGAGGVGAAAAVVHEGASSEKEMYKKYEICEVLGVGSTSTCHKCRDKTTNVEYACKIIDKVEIENRFRGMMEQFQTEINALRSLQHPHIIYLKDVYLTNEKIYIIMELMEGGELFDYVVQKGTLTEEEASKIIRQVTSALVYMHTKNIIHRDLKPENLLLTRVPRSPHDTPTVKIIDFGLSKCMEEPVARSFLGTRGYLAPEMLQRRQYSRQVDAWSLGVITYVLLCGALPFDDDSSAAPSDDVLRLRFKLRFPRWATNLSPSSQDLLSHLLDINPRTRYTAEQAMEHPWVKGETAPKNNFLQSPSMMRGKKRVNNSNNNNTTTTKTKRTGSGCVSGDGSNKAQQQQHYGGGKGGQYQQYDHHNHNNQQQHRHRYQHQQQQHQQYQQQRGGGGGGRAGAGGGGRESPPPTPPPPNKKNQLIRTGSI